MKGNIDGNCIQENENYLYDKTLGKGSYVLILKKPNVIVDSKRSEDSIIQAIKAVKLEQSSIKAQFNKYLKSSQSLSSMGES